MTLGGVSGFFFLVRRAAGSRSAVRMAWRLHGYGRWYLQPTKWVMVSERWGNTVEIGGGTRELGF